jgi:hypothetical protein
MAIEYQIDFGRRVVFATACGTVTSEDLFGYQREVWSRLDVAGFDEVVDMSEVEQFAEPSTKQIMALAELSAEMDVRSAVSRFAIVAPQDLAFGLGRMYEAYRGMNPGSTKEVAVFRTRQDALDWLGIRVQEQVANQGKVPGSLRP